MTALRDALLAAGKILLGVSGAAFVTEPQSSAVLRGLAGVSEIIAGLITIFSNDNDLVLECSILFD